MPSKKGKPSQGDSQHANYDEFWMYDFCDMYEDRQIHVYRPARHTLHNMGNVTLLIEG